MTNASYHAILFDLDGTLIDNQASYVVAFELLCRHYPKTLDPKSEIQRNKIVNLFHLKRPSTSYRWFCKTYRWQNPPSFEQFWELWTRLYTASATPFPCVVHTLEQLHQRGYRIGLITNGEASFQRAKLESSGLLPYLDHVVISGEVGIKKPDPQVYLISANALGVRLSDCLFVGNTNATDIAGAINAGMNTMLVQNENNRLHATYHAKSIAALLEIL